MARGCSTRAVVVMHRARPLRSRPFAPSTRLVFYRLAPGGSGERDNEDDRKQARSEEHTSELQSRPHLVCRLLLEKKKKKINKKIIITTHINITKKTIIH